MSKLKEVDQIELSVKGNTYTFTHSRPTHKGIKNQVTLQVEEQRPPRDLFLQSLTVSREKFEASKMVIYSFNSQFADHQKVTVRKSDVDLSKAVQFSIASKEDFAEMMIVEGPTEIVVFIYRYDQYDENKKLVFFGQNIDV